jgi:hypothetical protein
MKRGVALNTRCDDDDGDKSWRENLNFSLNRAMEKIKTILSVLSLHLTTMMCYSMCAQLYNCVVKMKEENFSTKLLYVEGREFLNNSRIKLSLKTMFVWPVVLGWFLLLNSLSFPPFTYTHNLLLLMLKKH